MARFEDLQSAYNQAAQARTNYWELIMEATKQLAIELSEYLGIPASHRVSVINSAPLPALAIGWFDQRDTFDHRPWQNLPRQGNAMHFALRIVFGVDRSGEVPIDAIFQLSIKQGDEAGVFVVQRLDDIHDEIFRGPSFKSLFDSLTQEALERILAARG